MKKPRIVVLSLLIICCLVTVQAWQLQPVAAGENAWTNIGSEGGPGVPSNLAFFPNYVTVPKIFAGSNIFDYGIIYLGTLSQDGWSWAESFRSSGGISALATAPDNLTVFAADYVSRVYKTADGGINWSNLSGVSSGWGIYGLAISPDYLNDQTVFLACSSGVRRSSNGGDTWTMVFPTYSPVEILAISPDYKNDHTIFAVQGGSIYRSENGGDSWQGLYNFPYMTYVTNLVISPNFAEDKTLFAQIEGMESKGLFKSADRGASWASVNDAVYSKLAISPNYATDGLVICYDPTQPRFLIFNEKLGGAWYADNPPVGAPGLGLNVFAFVPNFAGNKTVFAGVTNGGLYSYTVSMYDPLFGTPPSQPPKANAGPDQKVPVNVPVSLDGGGSSDPDNNYSLTYKWEIVSGPDLLAPGGGGTELPFPPLDKPTSVSPTFTPNAYGDYVVKLVVTDSTGMISLPAYVTISTVRSDPVAEAGPDQFFEALGTLLTLDGSQSYDYDKDISSYEWTIIQTPPGSNVTLTTLDEARRTFKPDINGDYVFRLVVRDSTGAASLDMVTVSCNNVKPVAMIGPVGVPDPGTIGQTFYFGGGGSYDPNGDKITYRWSFSAVPEGSQVIFIYQDPAGDGAAFIPDKAGTYTVNLVVNDGFLDSDPSPPLSIVIISVETVAISAVRTLQETILTKPGLFKNNNPLLQGALYNKLNAVINSLEANNVNGAIAQLQQDFLGKVDGSGNSWFLPGQDQELFYQELLKLIAMLEKAS